MRRFCARPAAVLLSAMGLLSARPVMVTRPGCSWELSSKKFATDAERAEERSQLERNRSLNATGMLSVCLLHTNKTASIVYGIANAD